MEDKDKPRNTKRKVFLILMIVLFVGFLVSGSLLIIDLVDAHRQTARYNELLAMVHDARGAENPLPEVTEQDVATEPEAEETVPEATEPTILPEYEKIYKMNPDLVGWITVPDTVIDYPVVQSRSDPTFYLKHNFDKEETPYGCIFAAAACDAFAPSDNVTLFGHNMLDGSMFTGLVEYLTPGYAAEHDVVYFDTLYEHHRYRVFAVLTTVSGAWREYDYYRFVNALSSVEFSHFVEDCKERSLYESEITPQYGDKLLCLSTCEHSRNNGRMVIVAVRDDPVKKDRE